MQDGKVALKSYVVGKPTSLERVSYEPSTLTCRQSNLTLHIFRGQACNGTVGTLAQTTVFQSRAFSRIFRFEQPLVKAMLGKPCEESLQLITTKEFIGPAWRAKLDSPCVACFAITAAVRQ